MPAWDVLYREGGAYFVCTGCAALGMQSTAEPSEAPHVGPGAGAEPA